MRFDERLFPLLVIGFFISWLLSCSPVPGDVKMKRVPAFPEKLRVPFYRDPANVFYAPLDSIFSEKHRNGFNGTVLIARKGKIIYKKSFGNTRTHSGEPIRSGTPFQLASVSKVFCAHAILKLVEQGKISLKDTLGKFFPGWPYPGITLHHLLSHRSGLPEYHYFGSAHTVNTDSMLPNVFFIQALMDSVPPLYHKTGTKFRYCNTNYLLLAEVISRVSGKSFPRFLKEEIFTPLGMKNSFVFGCEADPLFPGVAMGHDMKGKEEPCNFLDGVYGDKNVYASAADLYRFELSLRKGKVIADSLRVLSEKPFSADKKNGRNYGYGWRLFPETNMGKVVYHNGWWHGFNTCFFRRPLDETVIIVLGNKYSKEPYRIYGVLEILDGKPFTFDIE